MLPSTRYVASTLAVLFAAGALVNAELEALWLEPSPNWYGIDGNWSAFTIFVGEPAQQVDVAVSTTLSEIWVVEESGCGPTALCRAARGRVFDISASKSWSPLGLWRLALEYIRGNGEYAMDTVVVSDSAGKQTTTLQKQLVAAINTTDAYFGLFGVGITPGSFDGVTVDSPLARLVEKVGAVPSHSYGFTAGAYYKGKHGVPASLTLGGFDSNRFVHHSTTFSLESNTRQPVVRVRAITAEVTGPDKAPTKWASTSAPLLSFNESTIAVIDSSVPHLALPTAVCERFAEALSLKWNATLGVYTFSDSAVFDSFSSPDLSFTFSLSSSDNMDNFGQPLNVPGVVNITISANAFAQTLRYPFKNAINYGDAAIPYFPLTRADNEGEMMIGRAFLQEAYMITDYEKSTFSVHKALFPDDAQTNTSITTINSTPDSPYPGPAPAPRPREILGTPQIVGIVVGACLLVAGIIVAVLCLRKRKRKDPQREEDELKVMHSTSEPDAPTTPISRILCKITKPFSAKKAQRHDIHEAPSNLSRAVEVGADSSHERYELPVPIEPAELDASDSHSLHGATILETDDIQPHSVYEIARRKMERQLQGPLPEYTPPDSVLSLDDPAKGYHDVSRVAHYRPSDHLQADQNPSPASTNDHLAYPYALPSPMTSHGDWSSRAPDLPSPGDCKTSTFTRSNSNPSSSHSLHSPNTFDAASLSRSASSLGSPASPTELLQPPSPTHQRTRRASIDTSRVVCLGPLPSNIRPPRPSSTQRLSRPSGLGFTMPTIPSAQESRRHSAADTLGSNFTMNEESDDLPGEGTFGPPSSEPAGTLSRIDGVDLIHVPQPLPPASEAVNRLDPRAEIVHVPTIPSQPSPTRDRIDGVDVVHVPQPAQKRYSWEM